MFRFAALILLPAFAFPLRAQAPDNRSAKIDSIFANMDRTTTPG